MNHKQTASKTDNSANIDEEYAVPKDKYLSGVCLLKFKNWQNYVWVSTLFLYTKGKYFIVLLSYAVTLYASFTPSM